MLAYAGHWRIEDETVATETYSRVQFALVVLGICGLGRRGLGRGSGSLGSLFGIDGPSLLALLDWRVKTKEIYVDVRTRPVSS